MKKICLSVLLLLFIYSLKAQNIIVSGYVIDAESGERLINAIVYNTDNNSIATLTNAYGFFSLRIPSKSIKISASYIGYAPFSIEFYTEKDTLIYIYLNKNVELEKIIITGKIDKLQSSQMSQTEVSLDFVRKMPVLLGEVDVLKTIQLLPGVQSGNEGTSGIYVRGGGPDQNLILLDGVPVYNVNHLFGFFSVFNGYAISDILFVKGGFPARYGGRLSSVLDIRMKEGNMKKYTGEASLGLIASKFSIEGPIKKDTASFIISGRRTYYDLLTAPIIWLFSKAQNIDQSLWAGYFFYDLNAKFNYILNKKNRVYLSGYFGRDKAYVDASSKEFYQNTYYYQSLKNNLYWGNATISFRWNSVLKPNLFMNANLNYSNYIFNITNSLWSKSVQNDTTKEEVDFKIRYFSGIEDIATRIDFDFNPNQNHKIKFGPYYIFHIFKPGVSVFKFKINDLTPLDSVFGNRNIYGNELGFYFEDDFNVTKIFKINTGARFTSLILSDTIFTSLEPRLSMKISLFKKFALKASYAQMTQYLHLLTNNTIGLPTDLWLPATSKVPPEKSWQVASGFVVALGSEFDFSFESYYKEMTNIIEYKEGESFFNAAFSSGKTFNWDEKVEKGWGQSYGFEFLFEKKAGRVSGWLGYTLSWSWRKFQNISFGKKFPYRYDRRHDIGLLLLYKLADNIDFSLTWVYGTGIAVTLAQIRYVGIESLYLSEFVPYYQIIDYYGQRNNFRLPDYHRLDLGLNFYKKHKRGTSTISLSVYNAYNRLNPYFVQFENVYNEQTQKVEQKLYQYSLFPIIPSISYSFKFQ